MVGPVARPRAFRRGKGADGRPFDARAGSVVYEDVNDPLALGVLAFSEDPADFVDKV
jgi:hypothetical protein